MIPKRTALDEQEAKWLIGSVLANPNLAAQVDDLNPEDLSQHDYRIWLKTIQGIHRSGRLPDLVTVAEQLAADGTLEELGGPPQLMWLADKAPYVEHIEYWKKCIRRAAARRKLSSETLALRQMLDDPTATIDEIRERFRTAGSQLDGLTESSSQAVIRSVADVEAVKLDWLWQGRFPLGKISQISGDPGLGKSFLTLDIAARVTRGDGWPDDPTDQTPGSVMIFNSEDDIADTIRPRLEAAGAILGKVFFVEGVVTIDEKRRKRSRQFSLDIDLPYLAKWLKVTEDARLIILDPISAYCGKTDTHKNAEVRAFLSPIAELAARHRVSVICVNHLTKGGGTKAVYRSMGSLAFNAAARAVWSVNRDLDDPDRRLLLPAKMNLCKETTGIAYRIVDGHLAWEESPVPMTADEFLQQEVAKSEESGQTKTARQEAIDFLRDLLAEGPRPSKDVIAEAKEFGHTEKTIRRAFKDLGGKPGKTGFEGGWVWSLDSAEGGHEDAKMPTRQAG